jgi:hypothetical protein
MDCKTKMKTVVVPGTDAIKELGRLWRNRTDTGLHPILFGKQDSFGFIEKGCSRVTDPLSVIRKSMNINIDEYLTEYYQEYPEDFSEDEITVEEEDGVAGQSLPAPHEINLISDLDDEASYTIGLLEMEEPWHVFAHLGWGDEKTGGQDIWGCDFQCAMHRRWQEQWGAEVISMTPVVIECRVARPPLNAEDAMRLAREQYVYCKDIVHQGAGSLTELASILLRGKEWFFWWD